MVVVLMGTAVNALAVAGAVSWIFGVSPRWLRGSGIIGAAVLCLVSGAVTIVLVTVAGRGGYARYRMLFEYLDARGFATCPKCYCDLGLDGDEITCPECAERTTRAEREARLLHRIGHHRVPAKRRGKPRRPGAG